MEILFFVFFVLEFGQVFGEGLGLDGFNIDRYCVCIYLFLLVLKQWL